MKKELLFIALLLSCSTMAQNTFTIKGKVIDKRTREPLSFVNIAIQNSTKGTSTLDDGSFEITGNRGGTYRLLASYLGYKSYVSPEIMVGAKDSYVEIQLEESVVSLNEVEVVVGPYRKTIESPIALRMIGFTEIERSAGANRDISRVLQSFPGVASSPSGYRNDLIVRGGGPSENRFYLDGIEVPNINHFSTQGASGGPTGLISADLIQEVNFYAGAFPTNRGNAMSSVLDFKLKEGSLTNYNFSAVVGSSDFGIYADGHIGKKVTYLTSIRYSYLQLLFKGLNLPFLPTYTDAQAKIKYRINNKNELTFLLLAGLDDLELNTDTVGQTDGNKYILSSIPVIKQFTYTTGAVYKHYAGDHTQTVVLSRNYLSNTNYKHKDNNEQLPKVLDLFSEEREHKFRFENSSQLGLFRVQAGFNLEQGLYGNRIAGYYFGGATAVPYSASTDLVLYKWGVFLSSQFESKDGKFNTSLGIRTDAANFNKTMRNPLNQLSPRLSVSYQVVPGFYVNAHTGVYYQLPAYTGMGLTNEVGQYINSDLKYQRSCQAILGIEKRIGAFARITVEGFYKHQTQGLLSSIDSIPISSKGNDYGVVGAEPATSDARGRAYGVEVMARWFGYKGINFIASYTYVRSEFLNPRTGKYIASAWDNRHLLTLTGSYNLPQNWVVGVKYRLVGGAPFTPYDEAKTALIDYWNATGKAYPDYSRFNEGRLGLYNQLDLRVDKNFFFKKWMLAIYLDIQNATASTFKEQEALLSTGEVNPADPTRYIMKKVAREFGTIVPAIGVVVKF